MARTWAEFLGDAEGPYETGERRRRGFARPAARLALAFEASAHRADRSRGIRPGRLRASWERLEEALLGADVGVPATAELVARLEARQVSGDSGNLACRGDRSAVRRAADASSRCPASVGDPRRGRQRHRQDDDIGKLAQKLREHGRSVTVSAPPTRSARRPRNSSRCGRAGRRELVGGERGADPAAVAYDAVGAGGDVVIVDTAGRLHTQTNLMDELAKVRRVIAGRREGAPHEVLLAVDATTGQNGLQQAKLFNEAVGVTGVALTKLDGSDKRRHRGADRVRARPAREADRRGGGPRRPSTLRPARFRARARLGLTAQAALSSF